MGDVGKRIGKQGIFLKKNINKYVSWKWWIQHSGNIGGSECMGERKINKNR
jgi:hypothetical protein